ncbi:MAG: cation:proton antiporter [Candidatus Woesearchaeota archaeon]
MYQLEALYPITFIFVVGLVVSFFCHRWKMPMQLMLLATGVILSKLPLPDKIVTFPKSFVLGVAIFGLIMITYDIFSRIKPHRSDNYSQSATRITAILFGLTIVMIGGIFLMLQLTDDPFIAFLMCTLVAGLGAPAFSSKVARIKHFIETESEFNEALIIFASALLLEFIMFLRNTIMDMPVTMFMIMFSLTIFVGLGTGLFSGLVVFKIFRRLSKRISPIALIGLCLGVYLFAEALNGAGIFAIVSMAILFGAFTIKHKKELEEFSRTFSQSIEILMLLLLGMVVSIPLSTNFLILTMLIYLAYLIIRYLSLAVILKHEYFNQKELVIMTILPPKGIAVTAIALNAIFLGTESLMPLIQVIVGVIIYSQILSWATTKAAR